MLLMEKESIEAERQLRQQMKPDWIFEFER